MDLLTFLLGSTPRSGIRVEILIDWHTGESVALIAHNLSPSCLLSGLGILQGPGFPLSSSPTPQPTQSTVQRVRHQLVREARLQTPHPLRPFPACAPVSWAELDLRRWGIAFDDESAAFLRSLFRDAEAALPLSQRPDGDDGFQGESGSSQPLSTGMPQRKYPCVNVFCEGCGCEASLALPGIHCPRCQALSLYACVGSNHSYVFREPGRWTAGLRDNKPH